MKWQIFKVALLMIVLFLFADITYAQTTSTLWVAKAGGQESDQGYSIAIDGRGHSVITGGFTGSSDFGFGTTPLFGQGGFDVFVARYDSNGQLLWVKQAGGTGLDKGHAIAADGMGNSIVTGRFSGTAANPAIFGSHNLASSGGSTDIFVAKYDSNGTLLWVKQAGGRNEDQAFGLATDGIGNILVTGRFRGPTNDPSVFGTIQLFSAGESFDVFIAKYDLNGNPVWVKQAGGIENDEGLDIASDAHGNVYVTGRFKGQADFETSTLVSSDSSDDVFIAKYDTNGNLVWAKKAGGSGSDCGYGISVDAYGNFVITGKFEGTLSLDTMNLTGKGALDIFIARYDASGEILWAKGAGGSGDEWGNAVSNDGFGNTMVTGIFYQEAIFETKLLQSKDAGTSDGFIAKYDVDGELIWVKSVGGIEEDACHDLAMDLWGNGHVVGTFGSTAFFSPMLALTSAGEDDIFALKIGVPVGDINGDGKIGLAEAIHALQIMSRMRPQ